MTRQLDSMRPLEPPAKPFELRGESVQNLLKALQTARKNRTEEELIRAWQKWRFDVEMVEGRNELWLYTLLRCAQIFEEYAKEHPNQKDKALECRNLIKSFLGSEWSIADLDAVVAGDIAEYARIASNQRHVMSAEWRCPSLSVRE